MIGQGQVSVADRSPTDVPGKFGPGQELTYGSVCFSAGVRRLPGAAGAVPPHFCTLAAHTSHCQIDCILKPVTAEELPTEQPNTAELAVNQKSAGALDFRLPIVPGARQSGRCLDHSPGKATSDALGSISTMQQACRQAPAGQGGPPVD